MKKLLYILILAATSTLAITSCTEDEVKPTNSTPAGNGSVDPPYGG